MPSSLLVRAVFGALVVATVGAFFITQRLKSSNPVVRRVLFEPAAISPNGDGRADRARIDFKLRRTDDVTLSVLDDRGEEVRRLADDRLLRKGFRHVTWDGRTDEGRIAPDGPYRLRVSVRSEGRATTGSRSLRVDTTAPRPRVVAARPATIVPGSAPSAGTARLRHSGGSGQVQISVYRTDLGPARAVDIFRADGPSRTAAWDGRVGRRALAADGVYAFRIAARDAAGNLGTSPVPARANAAPGSGVSVRYLRVAGPLEPVQAGRIARFAVGPKTRRFEWRLVRAGGRAPVREGRAAGRRLAFRIPRDTRTGLHLLRVAAAGRSATVPLAVRGRAPGRSRGRGRVLVVLPAITWQGVNPVDDDGDGFTDTLDRSDAVQAGRPFAHGAPPAGLLGEIVPALRFLDRIRAPYELTTDLALARGRAPGIRGRTGVLFPGTERWLTERVDVALRLYVEAGGRVASFGTDAFRRRVSARDALLTQPSRPEVANVFGEKTSLSRIPPAPMVVGNDRLGLFAGTDRFIGLFSRFERSDGLVGGGRVLSAAGREPERPAFVAYRLRRGLVIRTGTPRWASELGRSSEVASVTRKIWALLSR